MGAGMKKKSSDSKLTSAVSHDVSDGLTGSKLLTAQLPDAGAAGSVVMRRAATIAVEDTDFDRVERGSILQDMRAGRVKVPKRRPPSVAKNRLGESNNNTEYLNGSSGGVASSASELSEDGGLGKQASAATASSDDNSTGGEEPQLVKPKPRDWEKKKAPWLEELQASQVTRKKTSPNVEPRGGAVSSVAERTSKLFATEQVTATSSVLTTSATSSSTNSSSISTSATKVQSSAVTSSSVQQFISVESSSSSTSSSQKKESNSTNIVTSNNNHNDAIMSKSSVSASKVTGSAVAAAGASSDEESRAARPSTLAIRKRSVSPLVKTSNTNATSHSTSTSNSSSTLLEKSNNISINDGPTTALQNNHQPAGTTGTDAAAPRVQQLEGRVDKLEAMVLGQQRTIEELMRLLREETERVKVLRGELDKYAQCVTQV